MVVKSILGASLYNIADLSTMCIGRASNLYIDKEGINNKQDVKQ